ncbi:hypothetical protein KQI42_04810 [Tissierella sp. MSJ-40]|uniref:Metanogen output domain-containing protein n=1 Tax=Tissierella simiarum TaxID=2841534 RepID=A0ABS6E341_9FIRM|nr:DUF6144 family protein [Tissierella simiarum]MBU5437317.1 hypothetical protein [Tissierella simiarum]
MSKKSERILDSIKLNVGEDTYENLIKICGDLPSKATSTKQGKYIRNILCELENQLDEEAIGMIMKPCGHLCISNKTINEAKKLYETSETIEEFLVLLNKNHIGGGELHMDNGNIIGVYNKCYCGIAKSVKDMHPTYCNCSAGWFEKLFESVFKKSVEVKKLQTILGGSDKCIFEIRLN